MKKYDLIIIGGGAAGFSAAIKANEIGAKTLLINDSEIGLGGTCINVGCVPTKFLLNISEIVGLNKNSFKGLKTEIKFNFNEIIDEKNKLVESLRNLKYENVLKNLKNVSFINEKAKFISQNEVLAGTEIYSAPKIIIATGSFPFIPSIKGITEVDFLTNKEALNLREVPERILIIGGGAIGIEFAQIFNSFGSVVYIVEFQDRILPNLDRTISDFYLKILQENGIEVFLNTRIEEIEKERNLKAKLLTGNKITEIEIEKILIATGRRPNIEFLDLKNTDVNVGGRGEIVVDEYLQAGKNIFAAGDVTGGYMLETVAAREGMIAANNALSCCVDEFIKMDYEVIPYVVFTEPKIASVGMREEDLLNKKIEYEKRVLELELLPKAKILKKENGMIKILIEREKEKILGIHIVSSMAEEIINLGAIILKNRMKLDDVINTVFVFPTFGELIKLCCQSFKKDIRNISCCVE